MIPEYSRCAAGAAALQAPPSFSNSPPSFSNSTPSFPGSPQRSTPPTAAGSPTSNSEGQKRRVSRACDRCKNKKSKCDGLSPCGPCTAHDHICIYTERKRNVDKPHPKGYTEELESQSHILRKALVELYRQLEDARDPSVSHPETDPNTILKQIGIDTAVKAKELESDQLDGVLYHTHGDSTFERNSGLYTHSSAQFSSRNQGLATGQLFEFDESMYHPNNNLFSPSSPSHSNRSSQFVPTSPHAHPNYSGQFLSGSVLSDQGNSPLLQARSHLDPITVDPRKTNSDFLEFQDMFQSMDYQPGLEHEAFQYFTAGYPVG